MTAGDDMTSVHLTGTTVLRLDAGGTMWRLRSLVAMGHDAGRIARALQIHPTTIQKLLRGETAEVEPELRDLGCQLWNAWWDKRPPERTRTERRQASAARRRAEQHGWCPPLGLDEDELDEPGYRPYSRYRKASGTGVAAGFHPLSSTEERPEIGVKASRRGAATSPRPSRPAHLTAERLAVRRSAIPFSATTRPGLLAIIWSPRTSGERARWLRLAFAARERGRRTPGRAVIHQPDAVVDCDRACRAHDPVNRSAAEPTCARMSWLPTAGRPG